MNERAVALATDFTQGGMRGGDVYVEQLSNALAQIDAQTRYLLFGYFFRDYASRVAQTPCPKAANFELCVRRWPQGLVRRLERLGVPVSASYLRVRGVELYHAPAPELPPLGPIRGVVSVHDIMLASHPQFISRQAPLSALPRIRDSLARAERVIASSTATKNDLINALGVPQDKIDVVVLGVDGEAFRPSDGAGARRKYSLPERFVFSAGPHEPRRNWENLIRAVAVLQRQGLDIGAAFSGSVRPQARQELEDLAKQAPKPELFRFLGYVPRADLAELYGGAAAFVYPTYYDGFNLPVLESMSCGTPVVTTARGALPEITAGAALFVDPYRPDSIAEGIQAALDEGKRAQLREKGFRRAKERSWLEVARQTLAIYRRVLNR